MNTRLKALPLVIAAVLATSTAAANDGVQIYGQANLSLDYLDAGEGAAAGLNVSSNDSRIGFKGDYKIDDSLTAFFQLELGVQLDNGNALATDRDSFVGFKGNWGQLRGGRFDTPLKALRGRTDLFGSQIGDSRNILRQDANANGGTGGWWDERFGSTIAYRSPEFAGGFIANLQYSTNQAAGTNDSSDNASYGASLEWKKDKLWLAAAVEDSTVGVVERKAARAAVSYEIGNLLVNALYQTATDPDNDAYGVGARYKLNSKVAVKGQYYALDTDAADLGASLAAIGVDYQYAKNLQFYVVAAAVDNEDLANRSPYRQGRSDGALDPVIGETASGVSIGTSLRF